MLKLNIKQILYNYIKYIKKNTYYNNISLQIQSNIEKSQLFYIK